MPIRNDQINNDNDFDLQNQPLQNASAIEVESTDKEKASRLITNNDGSLSVQLENTNNPDGPVTVRESVKLLDETGKLSPDVFGSAGSIPANAIASAGGGDVGKVVVVHTDGVAKLDKLNPTNLKPVGVGQAYVLRTNSSTGAWQIIPESALGSGVSIDPLILMTEQETYRTLTEEWNYEHCSFDLFEKDFPNNRIASKTSFVTYVPVSATYSIANGESLTTKSLIDESGNFQDFAFFVHATVNSDGSGGAVPFTLEYSFDNFVTDGIAFNPNENVSTGTLFSQIYVKINFQGPGHLHSFGCFYNDIGNNASETNQGTLFTTLQYTSGYTIDDQNISVTVPEGDLIVLDDIEGLGSLELPPNFFRLGTRLIYTLRTEVSYLHPLYFVLNGMNQVGNNVPSGENMVLLSNLSSLSLEGDYTVELTCVEVGASAKVTGIIIKNFPREMDLGGHVYSRYDFKMSFDSTQTNTFAFATAKDVNIQELRLEAIQPKGIAGLVNNASPSTVSLLSEGSAVASTSKINFGTGFTLESEVDGSVTVSGGNGSSSSTLTGLVDTNIDSPEIGQTIEWEGTKWVNAPKVDSLNPFTRNVISGNPCTATKDDGIALMPSTLGSQTRWKVNLPDPKILPKGWELHIQIDEGNDIDLEGVDIGFHSGNWSGNILEFNDNISTVLRIKMAIGDVLNATNMFLSSARITWTGTRWLVHSVTYL